MNGEVGYLNLVRDILENGELNDQERTGVGTLSLFGGQLRFNLHKDGFPLLTTKRVFWKGVKEELLWMIAGKTNAKELAEKDVHIWDANASREFLDKRGLQHYEEGELGPVYGYQWRGFGGSSFDQLESCVKQIKEDPQSRRMLVSAWNPMDIPKMALPPCHVMFQFHVSKDRRLSCHMYQRSADMGLGVPFNIASYALLTHLVANICKMDVGDLIISFGNVHIYRNHIAAMRTLLQREPRPLPTLRLEKQFTSLEDLSSEFIHLDNYNPHPPLSMTMAL